MRTLGVDPKNYKAICAEIALNLIQFPIVEIAVPSDPRAYELQVIDRIIESLLKGENVVVHCRGGMGRAGMTAACVSTRLFYFKSAKSLISFIREMRSSRAI